jgi:hypothetical protein
MIINRGKGSERRKNYPNASLSTFTLGLKPILCCKKLATSCLNPAYEYTTFVLEILGGASEETTGTCLDFLQITKANIFKTSQVSAGSFNLSRLCSEFIKVVKHR